MSRSTFKVRLRRGRPMRASQVALKLTLGHPEPQPPTTPPAQTVAPDLVPEAAPNTVPEAVPEIPDVVTSETSFPRAVAPPEPLPKITAGDQNDNGPPPNVGAVLEPIRDAVDALPASPLRSGGISTDDVPADAIRLTEPAADSSTDISVPDDLALRAELLEASPLTEASPSAATPSDRTLAPIVPALASPEQEIDQIQEEALAPREVKPQEEAQTLETQATQEAQDQEGSPATDDDDTAADEAPSYEGLFQSRHPVETPLASVAATSTEPSPEAQEVAPDPWQEPEDAPRTYSRGFVWLAMTLTFGIGLGIGLMTWIFSVALREDIPSSPELRRLAMENTALSQRLERENVELEAQQKKADDEDRRLRREWAILVDEIEALEREQDKATEQAQSLNDRLEIFVRRNDAVSQQAERPEDIRRQASALRDEGNFYRNALTGEMERLDDEKQRFRQWILRLEEQMKTRRVRGVAVRIIHDAQRRADADAVAKLLNAAGADAHLFVTDITQTEAHKGRIYYHGKAEEEAARQIARMVRAIEPIEAESIGVTNPFLSLWIVGEGLGQVESP